MNIYIDRMVLDFIQQHVVEYFGYSHVNALRTAISRFPDDPVINEVFYGLYKEAHSISSNIDLVTVHF